MSTRIIARCAVAVAALAGPATASAMPSEPLDSNAYVGADTSSQAAPLGSADDGGIGTTTVLLLAGGTLVAVGTGFGSGRAMTRRSQLSH